MIKTSEMQSQTEKPEPTPHKKSSSQKSIFALSVFALGINAASAAYTMSPADFTWPDVGAVVATLLPHERTPTPIPDTVVAALNDIQSAQQRHATELQGSIFLLKTKHGSAATECVPISTKHSPVAARCNQARYPKIDRDGRTVRCEVYICSAFDVNC
ncbi:MAG: hypothetical protein WDN50_05455 [Bradyrhizobium sp.]